MGLVSVDPSFELLNLTCWQDRNMGYIHYVDLGRSWLSVRNEHLPDKIEPLRLGRSHGMRVGPDALAPFRSLRGREGLEDDVATDVSRSADWTDGLSMLREDGLHVATEETERFVHTLTEIRLKIKLLDLSRRRLRLVRRLQIRISCSPICDGIYI